MENKKKENKNVNIVLYILLLVGLGWFIKGFISSGFNASGGFEHISNQLIWWFIFIIVAIIVVAIIDIFRKY